MILKINNLSKEFDSKIILNKVALTTKANAVLAIVGPSGSGKTTLLRCIAGLENYQGEIFFDDKLINSVPTAKRNIGLVSQDLALFPHLTVWENIVYPLKIRKIKKEGIGLRVNNILEKLNIAEFKNKLPQNISGGQQQRVAIARSLIYQPEVLLLDEPFAQLDQDLKTELLGWLKQILHQESILTLFVTHDLEDAKYIGDNIIRISNTQIKML
ncbi:MAG: ABC transporter ATP-binding protein [Patescibacteria group bacterium]